MSKSKTITCTYVGSHPIDVRGRGFRRPGVQKDEQFDAPEHIARDLWRSSQKDKRLGRKPVWRVAHDFGAKPKTTKAEKTATKKEG